MLSNGTFYLISGLGLQGDVAAGKGMQLQHLDVNTASLHSDIKEDTYVNQSSGLEGSKDQNLVCELQRASVGLNKQQEHRMKK